MPPSSEKQGGTSGQPPSMAKLTRLPDPETIDMLKGSIDFFITNGIPCARSWPRYDASHYPPSVQVEWASFAYINKLASEIHPSVRALLENLATGTRYTWKDFLLVFYYRAFPEAEKAYVAPLAIGKTEDPDFTHIFAYLDTKARSYLRLQKHQPTILTNRIFFRGVPRLVYRRIHLETVGITSQDLPGETDHPVFHIKKGSALEEPWGTIEFRVKFVKSRSAFPFFDIPALPSPPPAFSPPTVRPPLPSLPDVVPSRRGFA